MKTKAPLVPVVTVKFQNLDEETASRRQETLQLAKDVAREAALLTFAYLRSYTGELQGPGRFNRSPNRPAHPGHWADDVGWLKDCYTVELTSIPNGVQILLSVSMALNPRTGQPAFYYATALEEKEGYWVLSGVAGPGGPFEQALAQAALTGGLEVTV